ncbi:MAG: cell division protein ZapA [Hyphomicrobiales bacterium]|nr:cell division protein ZapA [Hyphomicrobiales bacterium]MCP5371671.1 cell division protein ZapA [Hyphomicrobiales bacterium]
MAQVSVTINNRKYDIACDDGQEAHLARLAAYVDKRIGELVAAVGQIGDARLLVMSSLLIADELSDAYADMEALRAAKGGTAIGELEERIGGTIDQLADRLEHIAERVEQA